MADFIRGKKILWPDEDSPATYSTIAELRNAIRSGAAPGNLREDLPDLDFWVGKRIGRNMPRRKKFRYELKKLEKPLSTWIVPSSDKAQVKELTDSDATSAYLLTKGTSEGTALLRRMLGDTEFPYPKPLQLVQSLVDQVTDEDDIVLDFFAGSGTTAHATLALNTGGGGDRRFILVSSTERTEADPAKNVCRDVCRRRVSAAIEGYSYSAKAGQVEVEGLGGDFAYLRCQRIVPGKLTDMDHEQVWTLLQLTHMPTLTTFDASQPFVVADHDGQRLIYVPHLRSKDVRALAKAVADSPACIVYTWQPELAKTRLRDAVNLQIEAVPEILARRFGVRI